MFAAASSFLLEAAKAAAQSPELGLESAASPAGPAAPPSDRTILAYSALGAADALRALPFIGAKDTEPDLTR